MIEKVRNILKYFFSLGLAAVLLYFSFRGVSWSDFYAGLVSCNWVYVLLSMLCGLFAFAIRAERWRQILKPIDDSISFRAAFNAINIGNISNFIFPFFGEVTRSAVIARNSSELANASRKEDRVRHQASFSRVLGTAVLERGWDVLTVMIVLAVLLVFKWQLFGGFMLEGIWNPLKSALGHGVFFLLALVIALSVGGLWFIYHTREKYRLCSKIVAKVKGFVQGLATCLKIKRKGLFMFYTLLIWAMYWLESVLVTAALPETSSLDLADALFIMLIGSFASVLPLPGGMGGYHFIIRSAMTLIYGLDASVGIAYAILAHESQALVMIIAGAISYLYETIRKPLKAYEEAQ